MYLDIAEVIKNTNIGCEYIMDGFLLKLMLSFFVFTPNKRFIRKAT